MDAPRDETGAALNAIAERYYVESGTRKPISYWIEYGILVRDRVSAPLRLLELGVASGASLLVWRDFLPNATIVGVDVSECPDRLVGLERIHFIRGSQDDPAILDQAAQSAGGTFDIIIDDASHIGYLTKRSCQHHFPRWLAPGGHYAIEDFGTSFLPEYPDGATFTAPPEEDATPGGKIFRSHEFGMAGFIKQLQDHMMQELMTGVRSRYAIERMIIRTNLAILEKAASADAA
jgi:hypothetical protein